MLRSISTVSLGGTIEDKLVAAAAAGFDAVQISEPDLLYFDGAPRLVRDMARDLGLKISGYQALRDFEGWSGLAYREAWARAERRLDVMGELGADLLLVTASSVAETSRDYEQLAAHLRLVAENAAQRKIRVAYGAQLWAAHVKHVEQAWKIVQRADHPNLAIFLNSLQQLLGGDDGKAVCSSIPGGKVAAVQVTDAVRTSMDPAVVSRFYSCLPGLGDLDLSGFLQNVLATGYDGALTLDLPNESLRATSARIVAEDALRSLLFLEEKVQQRQKSGKKVASLYDPPGPTAISGFEFLEFAASGPDADSLGVWLEGFGFRKTGTHRKKNVSLYVNGKVNLVLNAEPRSFAQSYSLMHGTSVCAVGLRADDDKQALGRAAAFRAHQFEEKIGPNELDIPAVRAPDGSLIYFVGKRAAEKVYEIEFPGESSVTVPRRHFDAVDHLALSLPADEMDSFILFYRAALGFDADAAWMLSDPDGFVKSRAVTSPGKAVRIPLNASQGGRTTTARQVYIQHGVGVHHIAFSCPDVFSTITELRNRGAQLLDISPNYYLDLAERFSLSTEFVDRLRSARLLYDRIGDGEFLHAYSQPFQGRFFFEFVQRIGGYDQYGAANASFRMAAIARLQRSLDIKSMM